MSFLNFNKSNNPMLREKTFSKVETLEKRTGGPFMDASFQMTVSGAVNKTFILVFLTLTTFLYSYLMPSTMLMFIGLIGGVGVYILTSVKPHLAPTTAPIYALIEGLFVGSVSAFYAASFEGIIFQAFSLTIATLLSMLMLYKSGLIKVTKSFRTAVSMAVMAIMIVYLISFIGYFAGFEVPFLHNSGPIGIGITVVIIGIAALNLLLDFDNFDKGEQMGAPKYMEWYYGMSLLFTLIWLYVEFLRLLSKLRD